MQDDALTKSQLLVGNKHSYNKSKPEYSQDLRKSKKNKPRRHKNQQNASELLSFKVEHKEHLPSKIFKVLPRSNKDITLSPYFRFAMKPSDYKAYHLDPDLQLEWESILKVRILADSQIKCPICLEEQLVAARVNKCGHYFCWPCVIRYLWLSQGAKRCPVCNDLLRPADLRPASIRTYQSISEGKIAEFSLIKRPKGLITLYKSDAGSEPTLNGIIPSTSINAWANKLSIYTEASEDYSADKSALLSALSTPDEFEKSSIQRALDLLDKQIPLLPSKTEFVLMPLTNYFYFYQLSDTQPYFLHPLNTSMLKRQFGDYSNFPLLITSKIIEIEQVHVTEYEQRKYGQLSHLGKNVVAYFVEVDMRAYCNNEVMKDYKEELDRRQRTRKHFKKIEEKIQARISRRRKGEEEANNLLNSYLENPVVAVVNKVIPDLGGGGFENEKSEEKVNEETKEESKSIWGNFGEVLKRPPREKAKIVEEEKKEEDDDDDVGPKKMTMFDLIKSKTNGRGN